MTPEFSRPVRLDEIGEAPRSIAVSADPAECQALARRFALVSIAKLEAEGLVHRDGETVHVAGRLRAEAVQSCVATGDPLPATLDVPFILRFVPEEKADLPEEVELSEDDCDTLTYADSAIDLGEAAAETLALSLDPFPRSPDADEALKAAGVVDETEVGPFAALKALKDRLGK
jgi:uncharacterized metal-binding protein YceD (DUF177 family)